MSKKNEPKLPLFFNKPPRDQSSYLNLQKPGSPADADARDFAIDPTRNVVLEASAGTGKTAVLVARYINLLRVGVDPSNILAITFTRQAAAEMRGRIIQQLRTDIFHSDEVDARWRELRDRLGEIEISTVDAFCLSLLREFPLEADLDPGFGIADETEVPRLIDDAAVRAMIIGGHLAQHDSGIAMLLAQLGPGRARVALTGLLNRRLVVPAALHRFLAASPSELTGERACRLAVQRLNDRLGGMTQEVDLLVGQSDVKSPRMELLTRDFLRLPTLENADPEVIRSCLERMRAFFLTQKGTARRTFGQRVQMPLPAKRRFRQAAKTLAPVVCDVLQGFDRDLNVVMVGAVQRLFGVAVSEYQRSLESRGLLDFSDVLQRTLDLLRRMDEFARSRYRLESRYHHVLVDEFQDTSRAQWELVSLLVQSWGEGRGLVHEAALPPTIFIVGDRKQSIYRFRDADVTVMKDATDEIDGLRPEGDVRRSIAHSFRAVPKLLGFINDLFAEVGKAPERRDAFRYDAQDRFPSDTSDDGRKFAESTDDSLGMIVADDIATCAEGVAVEVSRLLEMDSNQQTGRTDRRGLRPADIAILFRARETHRDFAQALERRSVPTYVYKGLGFFDADEVKDVRALIRFLAKPWSDLRAAAFVRSRFVGLSDPALLLLTGQLSRALVGPSLPADAMSLSDNDRCLLTEVRASLRTWLPMVDRLSPSEVLDQILLDGAYAFELRGPNSLQAWENVKKIRSIVRRFQNKGYATMTSIADHIDRLSGAVGNAVIEAFDAVNLMTVHAAKGLEFPVVFLVDLGRGTGTRAPAIRVIPDRGDGQPSVTVWPYRSQADEDERRRELEETKRLLYVATTRARSRLYLSTVLDNGGLRFSRGSFGEVLPPKFTTLFERAGQVKQTERLRWIGESGVVHEFRVCQVSDPIGLPVREKLKEPKAILPTITTDLSPIAPSGKNTRVPVTTFLENATGFKGPGTTGTKNQQRLIGRLAHRLLQCYQGRPVSPDELRSRGCRLLALDTTISDDILDNEIIKKLTQHAASLYDRFCAQDEVAALVGCECLFEVPFSFLDTELLQSSAIPPTVLRGTIDCLARSLDERVTVLEFKTGVRCPEHRKQLEIYVAATRAMFPRALVEGRLIYA